MKLNKNLLAILFGRLIHVLITLVTLRVMTTVLPQEQLGQLYVFFSVQLFFTMGFISPIGQFFNKMINQWKNNGEAASKFVFYVMHIFIVSVIAFVVQYVFYSTDNTTQYLVVALLIFSQSFNHTIVPSINLYKYQQMFVLLTLATSTLCALLSVLLVIYVSQTAIYWALGVALGNLVIGVIAYTWFWNKGHLFRDAEIKTETLSTKEILHFIIPIFFATGFIWFVSTGYRLILEDTIGLEKLAFITVGISVAMQVFSIVESVIVQYFSPNIYSGYTVDDIPAKTQLVNNYLNVVLPVYLLLALLLSISAKYVLPYLVGNLYYGAYIYMIAYVWVEFSRVITNVFYLVGQLENRTKYLYVPYIFATVVIIGFCYGSDTLSGIMFGLVMASLVQCLTMAFIVRNYVKYAVKWKALIILVFFSFPSATYFYFLNIEQRVSIFNFLLSVLGVVIFVVFNFIYLKRTVSLRT